MNNNVKKYSCPLEVTIAVIGGKWKCLIMWWLRRDARRFSELKLLIPQITSKVLTQQLRELEQEGLIARESYPESPPRVEYTLTNHGKTLVPMIEMMCEWGKNHSSENKFGYCHLTGVKVLVLAVDGVSICTILEARQAIAMSRTLPVSAANSIDEILSFIDSFQPNAVLVDVTMLDDGDTQKLMAQIAVMAGNSMPIIAIMDSNQASQRGKVFKMGFHVHLSKPVETIEMVSTIASLVENFSP